MIAKIGGRGGIADFVLFRCGVLGTKFLRASSLHRTLGSRLLKHPPEGSDLSAAKKNRQKPILFCWRKGRDSNPRYHGGTPLFESGTLNHSATLPGISIHLAR